MAKFSSRGGQGKKPSTQGFKKSLLKSKANAQAGFAKRQSKKDKREREDIQDVYEYVQEKTRRGKVRMDLDKDEAMEFGNLNEIDDSQREALRARLIGENDDDEKIDSEDDEELDSDAAFEESDEERFAEFFPKRKKVSNGKERGVRFSDVDLDEDEDEPSASKSKEEGGEELDSEEEGEDDEFIDLLDVLDGKVKKPSTRCSKPSSFENDDSHDQGSEESEGEMSEDGESSGEEDEEEDSDDGEENEMHIAASDEEGQGEDALDDLQNFVSNLDTTAPQKRKATDDTDETPRERKRRVIREKTETGAEDEFRIDSSGSKLNLDDLLAPLATQSSSLQTLKKATKILGSSKTKALSAPLPQRAQERLDREAAYEQTKEEAEHLSFPLQAEKPGRVSNMELAAKFKPTTGLESAVDALLKNAKMRDEDIQETEEGMLKANKLSVEEVAARRAELRKMRDLMFRAELKARRANKIKSKTYRKLRRKEKERLAEQIDEEEDSQDEEVQMKRALERAKERATLRHKHTGKWARQMKKGHLDEDQRKEITEMLSKGEKLKQKIQGVGSDESDEDESSDDDDLGPEEAVEKIKQSAFDELRRLREEEEDVPESSGKKGKSVFEMKFMKDAMARHQAESNREVDDFIKELGAQQDGSDDEGDDDAEHDPSSGVVVRRANGRVVYRPGGPSSKPSITIPSTVPPPSDTSSVTLKSTDFPSLRHQKRVVLSKESKSAEKSKNKLKKQELKHDEERARASSSKKTAKALGKRPAGPNTSLGAADDSDNDSDANSEVDAQERALSAKSKGKGKAESLVALAFAGDNVVKTKKREIAEDAPKEVDTTIPGWVRFMGWAGMRKKPPKPQYVKKIAGIDPTTRADYNKKHIIISEKKDKKRGNICSQAQYEKAMERPLRATLPRVVKKPGVVITPLEKMVQ
ncbi:Utp14-domain-containing protein [Coprinellus micaceus]|uniref:Utp14-domain-containing protein n=1 Tax=Coprinellus micaceus TaxID=71717 RepID=A0A4Y7SAR3_COPMI|nr:Utp14-domain-containing protein [Coprinellus micaceus]